MLKYGEQYNSKLLEVWEKFIQYEPIDESFVRAEILESWKRSRSNLVDPYHYKTAIIPKEEIENRIEKNKSLIDVSRPYMHNLFSVVKDSGFYLMLVDKDGYILYLVGDEDIIEHAKQHSLLIVGANRSEQFAGTNAIGVPLVTKKPIQVWGNEHYMKPHKDYTCSGAPIFDEFGELLGCLNITGRYNMGHPHTLGMVISAVDGISKELQLRKAATEITRVNKQLNKIIETSSSGLMLLNNSYEVMQYNTKVLSLLGISNKNLTGKSILDFLRFGGKSQNPLSILEFEAYNTEINVYCSESPEVPHRFNISINFVLDGENARVGTVVSFNETKKINKLVNRISGYTSKFTFDSIIGSSPIIESMLRTSKKAAQTTSNVLILGESGVGKELVAQSIHNASSYSQGPFVAINCGALPKGLVESELFGYESGAFTGANKDGNPGKFELADGGTIFLDEIGDMPLDVQVTLLRVLETREITRIGGKYPKHINVRVIAATNSDIVKAMADATFRSDLYYRLNVHTIEVPPLRARENDICALADYFVRAFCKPRGISMTVSSEVYPLLMKHEWPGNVRELENVIERAVALSENGEIGLENMPDYIRNIIDTPDLTSSKDLPAKQEFNLESIGYDIIVNCLKEYKGNINKTSEMLGVSRRTLYRTLEKYNLDYKQYRKRSGD